MRGERAFRTVNVVDEEDGGGDPPGAPVAILGVADGRWCGGGSRSNGRLVDGRFSRSSQLTRSPAVLFRVEPEMEPESK